MAAVAAVAEGPGLAGGDGGIGLTTTLPGWRKAEVATAAPSSLKWRRTCLSMGTLCVVFLNFSFIIFFIKVAHISRTGFHVFFMFSIKTVWKINEICCDNLLNVKPKHVISSDFSLISNFFNLTPLEVIFEISSLGHVLNDCIVNSDFQKKFLFTLFQTFSWNLTYISRLYDIEHSLFNTNLV